MYIIDDQGVIDEFCMSLKGAKISFFLTKITSKLVVEEQKLQNIRRYIFVTNYKTKTNRILTASSWVCVQIAITE